MSIIQGNIAPFVKLPEPKHPGFFKQLVSFVVMAVAIVLAAGTGGSSVGLGMLIAGMLEIGGVGAMAITAVVAGLADAAMQGVLAGFGVKEFSITESIATAFAAFGASWTIAPTAPNLALQAGLHAGTVNIAEQLTLMALGKQSKLDFIQAASAILGSTVDKQMAKTLNIKKPLAQNAMHHAGSAAIGLALKGRLDWEQVAVQMLSSGIMEVIEPAVTKGLAWANKTVFHPESASQTQAAAPVAKKHPSNATKENVNKLYDKPNVSAEDPHAFEKRLGIDEVMEDYAKAKEEFSFEEEPLDSYIPSINMQAQKELSICIEDLCELGKASIQG